MRRAIMLGAILALGACARGEPDLINFRAFSHGPDEFGVLPTKPLVLEGLPQNVAALPPPAPGVGGGSAATSEGSSSSESGLVGSTPNSSGPSFARNRIRSGSPRVQAPSARTSPIKIARRIGVPRPSDPVYSFRRRPSRGAMQCGARRRLSSAGREDPVPSTARPIAPKKMAMSATLKA